VPLSPVHKSEELGDRDKAPQWQIPGRLQAIQSSEISLFLSPFKLKIQLLKDVSIPSFILKIRISINCQVLLQPY
jgi:hypothetical protein